MTHAILMDYKSTLQGLEGFWNSLAGFSEHEFEAWVMLYALVKVRGSQQKAHCCEQDALFTLSHL